MKKIIMLTLLVFWGVFTGACAAFTSIENPASLGETIYIGRQMSLKIVDVIRPADSYFSVLPPPSDFEYVLLKVQVECKNPKDMTCGFGMGSFKFTDQTGQVYETEFIDVYYKHESDEIYGLRTLRGGSTEDIEISYLISKSDAPSILVYSMLYVSPAYFSLP